MKLMCGLLAAGSVIPEDSFSLFSQNIACDVDEMQYSQIYFFFHFVFVCLFVFRVL